MGDAPRWFQLYWSTADELVASFVHRAEACRWTRSWSPRHEDARLAVARPRLRTCRSRTGRGIAQYTSDPVFRSMASPPGRRPARHAEAIRSLVRATRSYPGSFRENLRSGAGVAAVRR